MYWYVWLMSKTVTPSACLDVGRKHIAADNDLFDLSILTRFIKMTKNIACLYFVLASLLVLCGCGQGTVNVTGKVTVTDGTPVTGGKVLFSNQEYSASGTIGADGTYSVGGLKDGSGIPAGTYKVRVTGVERPLDKEIRNGPAIILSESLIDDGFSTTCTVENKSLVFDIAVPPNPTLKN